MNRAVIVQVIGYVMAAACIAYGVALWWLAGRSKAWPRERRVNVATGGVVLWLCGAVFALATTLIAESLR